MHDMSVVRDAINFDFDFVFVTTTHDNSSLWHSSLELEIERQQRQPDPPSSSDPQPQLQPRSVSRNHFEHACPPLATDALRVGGAPSIFLLSNSF